MSTDAELVRNIKSQTLQLIVDITAEPKPSYDVDGQSISWEQYLARLQQTVDWCDAKLNGAEPFEFETRAESLP